MTDDSQIAVARLGETDGLDASFGSNRTVTVHVAVGVGKNSELARAVVVQFDGKVMIAGLIEHDTLRSGMRHKIPILPSPGSIPRGNWIERSASTASLV